MMKPDIYDSLQKISRCKARIPTDQVWLGHNKEREELFREREENEKNVQEVPYNKQ